jgi:hypothetical protein
MVLVRFEEVLAENANQPLHLEEICSAIGTPERRHRQAAGRLRSDVF